MGPRTRLHSSWCDPGHSFLLCLYSQHHFSLCPWKDSQTHNCSETRGNATRLAHQVILWRQRVLFHTPDGRTALYKPSPPETSASKSKDFHSLTGFYRIWRKMCEESWRVRKQKLSMDLLWGNLESCWHWLNLCWVCEGFYQWPQWELYLQPVSLAGPDLQTFLSVLIFHWSQTVQITKKNKPNKPKTLT